MANMALKAYCWIRARAAAFKNNKGLNTLEMMMILGVATILLIATYFKAKDFIVPWWDGHIVPQFPQ